MDYATYNLVKTFKEEEQNLRRRMTSILQAIRTAIKDFQAQEALLLEIQAEVDGGDTTRLPILDLRQGQLQTIEDDPGNTATATSYMELVQELVGTGAVFVAKADELDELDPTLFPGYVPEGVLEQDLP